MRKTLKVNCIKTFLVGTILVVVPLSMFLYFSINTVIFVSEASHSISKREIQTSYSKLGESLEFLNVFVQLSDVHLSYYQDPQRGPELRQFLDKISSIVKPQLVIISGDLTEAKSRFYVHFPSSHQIRSEWEEYLSVMQEFLLKGIPVIDIRGNHDAFRVPSLNAKENLYRRFSVSGKRHARSYLYQHQTPWAEQISFLTMDGCPDPGPSRPHNFFGNLNKEDIAKIRGFLSKAQTSNFTVLVGHYPSSTMISPNGDIQKIVRAGPVYLCGHLHNLAPTLYTRHKRGGLELELADWKNNRRFRVFAIDHGLFSFTDETYDNWPVVLITNPKDCHYKIPHAESSNSIRTSTHIRILVFANVTIKSVTVSLDGRELGSAQHSDGALYTLPWKSENYSAGVHTVNVEVETIFGSTTVKKQKFCVDDTLLTAGGLRSAYILKFDHATFIKVFYFLSVLLHLFILVVFRWRELYVEGQMIQCRSSYCCNKWFRRLGATSGSNAHFYFLVLLYWYASIGPWYIGEISENQFGAVFVYGVLVGKVFLPGLLTYIYGLLWVWGYVFPLHLYLAYLTDQGVQKKKDDYKKRGLIITTSLVIIFVVCPSLALIYEKVIAYGPAAFFFNPLRVWSLIVFAWLSIKAYNHCDCVVTTRSSYHLVEN